MVEAIKGLSNKIKDKILNDGGPQLTAPDEEIKTALQLKIFGRETLDGATYYVIRTWLVYSPGEISDAIRKRYSEFYSLHEKLERLGYQQLPTIPKK